MLSRTRLWGATVLNQSKDKFLLQTSRTLAGHVSADVNAGEWSPRDARSHHLLPANCNGARLGHTHAAKFRRVLSERVRRSLTTQRRRRAR